MIYTGGTKKYMVPREEFFAEALYTIDIGQNDLTSILFSPNMSPENYLQDALQRLATVIKEIYKTGGRYFWIHNTGPLGCLPYVLVRPPVGSEEMDETGCRIFYNALAEKYNAMLNETVVKLREKLPAASLTLVDVYSAKYHLITHASNYAGFENPLKACCGDGDDKYNYNVNARCGQTKTVNGVNILLAKSCKDPQKRINWDGAHYTEAANKWVFDKISTGQLSDPPHPLIFVCRQN
ncbi:GDSL esterase/lipase [Rhynchospora pubera]|uniref:GDSL esterase/lipase n=1 Tax=Rhynchospora pubera TaxID=906938 RepID=A0AAV8H8Y4_9POAL|nr:GDSL esterase/lipase [Rhynchospora pubera]